MIKPDKQTIASTLTVRPVMSYRDMSDFIDVPWHIYTDDPMWVPPLRLERRFHFSKYNPFLQHSEWQAWVAYQNNQPVGRISAQIDTLHRERYGNDTGHFGLFECVDDDKVCNALILHAESWLAARQTRQITGPFNLSINQECGILIDGFETPPVVMMPHTARWYPRLLEEQGYQPVKDLLAYWIAVDFEAPRVMQQLIKRHADQIHIRTIKRKQFAEEMEVLRDIFNDAWSENWGFVPFTEAEFAELGSSLKYLVPDEYIQIAEVDGYPAAFMAALPNLNEVFAKLNGRLFPLGWLKLVRKLKKHEIHTARIPLMGVRRQFHNTPLGMALACRVIEAPKKIGLEHGISGVELSWILEDNMPMRNILKNLGSKEYKRYRIYGKTL
ncbi:MAG: N-acetyltransferase [Nitrosomonas sp.]|nr:N-acetyltransferase [Nitrosomonas sp.]